MRKFITPETSVKYPFARHASTHMGGHHDTPLIPHPAPEEHHECQASEDNKVRSKQRTRVGRRDMVLEVGHQQPITIAGAMALCIIWENIYLYARNATRKD